MLCKQAAFKTALAPSTCTVSDILKNLASVSFAPNVSMITRLLIYLCLFCDLSFVRFLKQKEIHSMEYPSP